MESKILCELCKDRGAFIATSQGMVCGECMKKEIYAKGIITESSK